MKTSVKSSTVCGGWDGGEGERAGRRTVNHTTENKSELTLNVTEVVPVESSCLRNLLHYDSSRQAAAFHSSS